MPTNREVFSFAKLVPAKTQVVMLTVRIHPRTGTIAIYADRNDARALVICKGPIQHASVGYGTGEIFLESLPGTTAYEIKVAGWS